MRTLDIIFSVFGILLLMPLFLILFLFGLFDTGSPLFFQQRVGLKGKKFCLVKFRTMRVGTASVATHLADSSTITGFGSFLRKTKLDELPQLWNVLKGEMSLVGPRPCLFDQYELISKRTENGIFEVRPGITGLAQINGIDMSIPSELVIVEAKMIHQYSIYLYLKLILLTVLGKGSGDKVVSR